MSANAGVWTYQLLLFLHFMALLGAFGTAVLGHVAQRGLRNAELVADAKVNLMAAARLAARLPQWALALFLTGGALTQARWSWSTPWIVCATLGLVVMVSTGVAYLKPRMQALGAMLGKASGPRVEGELAAALSAPHWWVVGHVPTAIAMGIVFIMVMKPGWIGCITTLVIAIAVGIVYALTSHRRPSPIVSAAS
jgi:hypothetical protein